MQTSFKPPNKIDRIYLLRNVRHKKRETITTFYDVTQRYNNNKSNCFFFCCFFCAASISAIGLLINHYIESITTMKLFQPQDVEQISKLFMVPFTTTRPCFHIGPSLQTHARPLR